METERRLLSGITKEEQALFMEIAEKINELFDLRPRAIEERLKLRNPIYSETAAYGHMGREPQTVVKHFESAYE